MDKVFAHAFASQDRDHNCVVVYLFMFSRQVILSGCWCDDGRNSTRSLRNGWTRFFLPKQECWGHRDSSTSLAAPSDCYRSYATNEDFKLQQGIHLRPFHLPYHPSAGLKGFLEGETGLHIDTNERDLSFALNNNLALCVVFLSKDLHLQLCQLILCHGLLFLVELMFLIPWVWPVVVTA